MTIEINDNLLAIIDLLKALLHISLFSSAIFVFFSANCVFFFASSRLAMAHCC